VVAWKYWCQKAKRSLWVRLIKGWGSLTAKKGLWDEEFASGAWNYLESTREDPIYTVLERYCRCGSILDLGCGSGNTANEMEYSTFAAYTGTDISEIAVQKASERARGTGREEKTTFVCAPMESFTPQKLYDVILFRESLFYIPLRQVDTILRRYAGYLSTGGVLIVRMCNRKKYAAIIQRIRGKFHVVEQRDLPGGMDVIIVFRPPTEPA
jgi:2-polyprenyl-6-hydroxyphenyl methylase/3-demethylubiquinone-9 3-methyltransferase